DEGPAWSLIVGVTRGALCFHRLRVARSGRIFGRSNGVLKIFHDLKSPPGGCDSRADAALAPDGRSLCVVQREENEPTNTLQPLRPPLQVRQLPAQLGTAFSSPSIAPPSPDSGWTKVIHTSYKCYLPIYGRGLYAQESNGEYMLWNDVVYEYKLAPSDEETSRLIKLHPPARIDSVCPFIVMKGDGFLAHLGSGIMCSVWISLDLTCRCDYLHAIVTTFHIGPLPSDVKILHSTFRRVDMLPMKHIHEFQLCFLQEYMDDKVPAPQLHEEQVLLDDPCRHYLPPSPPRYMKPRIDIDKDLLFIICQGGSQSFIYKTNLDEIPSLQTGAPPLKPHYIVHGDDHGHRHFFRSSSKLCAVSFLKDGMDVIILDTECHTMDILARRPVSVDPFVMVINYEGDYEGGDYGASPMAGSAAGPRHGGWFWALAADDDEDDDRYQPEAPSPSPSDLVCESILSGYTEEQVANSIDGFVPPSDSAWDGLGHNDDERIEVLRRVVHRRTSASAIRPWKGPIPKVRLPALTLADFIDTWKKVPFRRKNFRSPVSKETPASIPAKTDLGIREAREQPVLVRFRPPKNQLWITAVRVETEKTPSKSMKPVETKHLLCATSIIDQVEGIDQEEVIRTT
ncbi:hypothetical protein ZWY2020_010494, partial [Hordeum vulgare]